MRFRILIFLITAVFFTSCKSVKEYEKMYINDPYMVLGTKKVDRFETNFQAYREAAAGANGGTTGGGCGCN